MTPVLKRILEYRRDELMRGRDPGFCFVRVDETRELADTIAMMLSHLADEETTRLSSRLEAHVACGQDPFVLNGLKLFGMVLQVEGYVQDAA